MTAPKDGQLYEFKHYDRDLQLDCDVLVVGSGPGGAIAAHQLARAGHRVVVLEAGPVVRPKDTQRNAGFVLSRYFFYGGLRATRGNSYMPTMQPCNLGGGSVWNSAICLRTPPFILKRWQAEHGLVGLSHGGLDHHYRAVEQFMGVRTVSDQVLGPRNVLFRDACLALGYTPTPIDRNEDGCKGSGECFTQCPNQAKLSTDRRGIPQVLALGGQVYTSVAAHQLLVQGTQVQGVQAFVVDPASKARSYSVRVRAKTTVMAAGCLATPELLQRSGIDRAPIGQNLRFHPGTMVMGVFDEPIEPWSGATQGYHCLDFLPQGIKLEALWATASLMAFRFPGFGKQLQDLLKNYRYMCSWDAWVSGDDSVGRVRRQRGRRADVTYHIGQGDVDRVQEAMAKLSDMFFAVGAKSVLLGAHGLPPVSSNPRIGDVIRRSTFTVHQFPLASNHIFGTTAMGADPTRHAVDPTGAVYGFDHLYVCDTGILPGTPGANPMLPTMALSHKIAQTIAARMS